MLTSAVAGDGTGFAIFFVIIAYVLESRRNHDIRRIQTSQDPITFKFKFER
jgi:hypothetical protein